MKAESAKLRVLKFLTKMMKGGGQGWNYSDAPDQRQGTKVVHSMDSIHWALEIGLTTNQPTLRDAEEMTSNLGSWAKKMVPTPISDTTLDTEAQHLDSEFLQSKLVQ